MSRMIWCWLWRSQWWNFCRFKWAPNLTWRLKREPKNLQPRQTELPPHLINSSLKLILHFIKHSSASGNSWLEVCNWDILENTHTFRNWLTDTWLTDTLHRTTSQHQSHGTENGQRTDSSISCCDLRSLLVTSVTWTRTKNRFFHLFQTFLPMAHKYLGEKNRWIQHTSVHLLFSCFSVHFVYT